MLLIVVTYLNNLFVLFNKLFDSSKLLAFCDFQKFSKIFTNFLKKVRFKWTFKIKVNFIYFVIFKDFLSHVCMKTILIIRSLVQVVPFNMLITHVKITILILNQNQNKIFMKVVDSAQNLSAYYKKGNSNVCYNQTITF